MTTTRAQRRKARSWHAPEHSVDVGTGTPWANPYSARPDPVGDYRLYVAVMDADARRAWLAPLKDKVLLCWCKPGEPCHADVLVEWVEGEGM